MGRTLGSNGIRVARVLCGLAPPNLQDAPQAARAGRASLDRSRDHEFREFSCVSAKLFESLPHVLHGLPSELMRNASISPALSICRALRSKSSRLLPAEAPRAISLRRCASAASRSASEDECVTRLRDFSMIRSRVSGARGWRDRADVSCRNRRRGRL